MVAALLIHTRYLCNEECKTNADWCDEGVLALLCGEHENGKDKLARQEHLEEDSLSSRHAWC